MKLATVALTSALVLSLGICSKPSAHAEAHVKDDGVHVRVYLDGVDEVEIAGRTLGDEETVVVPFSEFGVGLNQLPITGKGLDNVVAHVDLSPDKVLQFNCGEEKRKASIEVVTAEGKPPTPNKWREFGC
ncbi:MAG TPA: hypothetical protein VM869_33955, partial [Enhygromyxa sp.]|nr:hypothetical protein [Enhygromyxa sp.]